MTREEAINIVRNIYQTDKEKEALATLIPELAESEDERIRKRLEILVQNAVYPGLITEQESKNYLAYLEKQKSAEWSEEDEKLLDFWLDVIDRNDWRMDENFCKASREFINRLKSLRPSWKPSEEQPSLTDNLDEAAEEYMKKARKHLFDDSPIGRADDAFKAGAEWMAKQMNNDN